MDFRKEFSLILKLKSLTTATADVEDEVLNGKIDLAVIYDSSEKTGLEYHELFRDEMFAIVPKDHPWSMKSYLQPEDFENQSIIIHSFPLESVSLFSQVLLPNNVKPKNVIQIQVVEAAIEMVKAGLGVKVMAKWIIEPYLKDHDIELIPVTKRGMHRTWYAITLDQKECPQYLQNFVHHLRANIGFALLLHRKLSL